MHPIGVNMHPNALEDPPVNSPLLGTAHRRPKITTVFDLYPRHQARAGAFFWGILQFSIHIFALIVLAYHLWIEPETQAAIPSTVSPNHGFPTFPDEEDLESSTNKTTEHVDLVTKLTTMATIDIPKHDPVDGVTLFYWFTFMFDSFSQDMLQRKDMYYAFLASFLFSCVALHMIVGMVKSRPGYLRMFFIYLVSDFILTLIQTFYQLISCGPNLKNEILQDKNHPFHDQVIGQNRWLILFLASVLLLSILVIKMYFMLAVWTYMRYLRQDQEAVQAEDELRTQQLLDAPPPDYDVVVGTSNRLDELNSTPTVVIIPPSQEEESNNNTTITITTLN